MAEQHIPFMFLPPALGNILAKRFRGIAHAMKHQFPDVEENIKPAAIPVSAEEYLALALTNALFLSGLFALLMFLLMTAQYRPMQERIMLTFAIFFGIFLVFLLLYIKYPSILAIKRAELIDQDLMYSLKDLVLQISSGISLYEAFRSLAKSEYPEISDQFHELIIEIDSGKSMITALEELALATKSQYLKRTAWQIVNSLKTGTNLKDVLNRIIHELADEQKNKIRNYARELNLWSLLYMLFAVAVPSIGSTMLVILSSFAGFGINKNVFILFIVISIIVQIILIGFVKSRRPAVGM